MTVTVFISFVSSTTLLNLLSNFSLRLFLLSFFFTSTLIMSVYSHNFHTSKQLPNCPHEALATLGFKPGSLVYNARVLRSTHYISIHCLLKPYDFHIKFLLFFKSTDNSFLVCFIERININTVVEFYIFSIMGINVLPTFTSQFL